jgi:hypothetical protein
MSTITSKTITAANIKGSAISREYSLFYLLVDIAGLVELDSISGNVTVVVPLRQNCTFVSLSSNLQKNSTLLLNELSNYTTSPRSIISKYNITSSEYSPVLSLPYYANGPIAYDTTNDYVFIYNSLNLFIYSIGQSQLVANITVSVSWMLYSYYTNDPPYCPNGCSNNGKCDLNNACDCSSGWISSDCSQCNSLGK